MRQKKHIAVYLRVSTTQQDLQNQEPDLRAWLRRNRAGRPVTWYRDHYTGKTMDRPDMRKLEAAIQAGRVAKLVVWRIDRLGRTARELLNFLDSLETAGVEFAAVHNNIDTKTPEGRLLRHLLVAFTEYERELISERVKAGITRARAQGTVWQGRKPGTAHPTYPRASKSNQSAP